VVGCVMAIKRSDIDSIMLNYITPKLRDVVYGRSPLMALATRPRRNNVVVEPIVPPPIVKPEAAPAKPRVRRRLVFPKPESGS
jgi:hypothetical protein